MQKNCHINKIKFNLGEFSGGKQSLYKPHY